MQYLQEKQRLYSEEELLRIYSAKENEAFLYCVKIIDSLTPGENNEEIDSLTTSINAFLECIDSICFSTRQDDDEFMIDFFGTKTEVTMEMQANLATFIMSSYKVNYIYCLYLYIFRITNTRRKDYCEALNNKEVQYIRNMTVGMQLLWVNKNTVVDSDMLEIVFEKDNVLESNDLLMQFDNMLNIMRKALNYTSKFGATHSLCDKKLLKYPSLRISKGQMPDGKTDFFKINNLNRENGCAQKWYCLISCIAFFSANLQTAIRALSHNKGAFSDCIKEAKKLLRDMEKLALTDYEVAEDEIDAFTETIGQTISEYDSAAKDFYAIEIKKLLDTKVSTEEFIKSISTLKEDINKSVFDKSAIEELLSSLKTVIEDFTKKCITYNDISASINSYYEPQFNKLEKLILDYYRKHNIPKSNNSTDLLAYTKSALSTAETLYAQCPNMTITDYSCIALEYYVALESLLNAVFYIPYRDTILVKEQSARKSVTNETTFIYPAYTLGQFLFLYCKREPDNKKSKPSPSIIVPELYNYLTQGLNLSDENAYKFTHFLNEKVNTGISQRRNNAAHGTTSQKKEDAIAARIITFAYKDNEKCPNEIENLKHSIEYIFSLFS